MFHRLQKNEPQSTEMNADESFVFHHEAQNEDTEERNLGIYGVDEDEDDTDEDNHDEGDTETDYDKEADEEAFRKSLRKPVLSLSTREKNDICRYKSMKPDTCLRQISEHFSQLWNKIVCPRSVYDTVVQNEKWIHIECRARHSIDCLSQNPIEDVEKLLVDWITEILKAEARVWDEDVRNAAAIIRDIKSLKDFTPSPAWLNDFKYRHEFEIEQNDGSIISHRIVKPEEDLVERERRQIRIDIGDGLSYEINIGVRNANEAQIEKTPPLSMLSANPCVRRGGPYVPPNRMTDIQLTDSDEDEEGQFGVGFQVGVHDDGIEALLGSACSSSFHHVLKHIVYGPHLLSEKAQEMMSAATEVALNAELFGEASDEQGRKRNGKRARLIAELVEKVFEAKTRRDEALIEMYQEKKLRDLNAFKVSEEQRKRYIERRELHAVKKKILDIEERFFCDQQRNELIRQALLLVDEPIGSAVESESAKKVKLPQAAGTSTKRRKTESAIVTGGVE